MIPQPNLPLYGQLDNKQLGIKQLFSPQEDEFLKYLVSVYGDKDWKFISKQMPNRTTRQCRERYKNYLAPEIINGAWTEAEDELLRQKYEEFGPKWSKISTFFQSRSDVNIKNHWNTLTNHISKTPKFKVYLATSPINSAANQNDDTSDNIPSIDNNQDINSPILPTNDIIMSPTSPHSTHVISDQSNHNPSPPHIASPKSTTSPIQKSPLISISPHNQTENDGKFRKDSTLSTYLHSHSVIRLATTNSVQTPSLISQLDRTQQNLSGIQSNNQSLLNNSQLPPPVKQVTTRKNNISSSTVVTGSTLNSILNHEESRNYQQVNSKKKQPFPPISSLSQTVDDKVIADRVFLSGETKMDESLLTNLQNMTLTNTFPNYGGNVW
mgnify:CR=1 FL=1